MLSHNNHYLRLLIVDEIQNVVNSKNGKSLIGSLTQLINNSGISICMLGTPESSIFFEQAMQLARRSLGLQYEAFSYDVHFRDFCDILFSYQYVKNKAVLTDSITNWLYEHSGGITSVVVSLIHDAQEIAILTGKEKLCMETLNEAYQKRLSLLHGYININHQKVSKTCFKSKINLKKSEINDNNLLKNLLEKSRSQDIDILNLLKQNISVEEISI